MEIQTDEQHKAALVIIEMLMDLPSSKATALEEKVLNYLAAVVRKYEAVRYPREK